MAVININCKRGEHTFEYIPSHNEAGWVCVECDWKPGENPGYDPFFDRDLLTLKIVCISDFLGESNLYNYEAGDLPERLAWVEEQCIKLGKYDQVTIARLILETDKSHADFWKTINDGILSGKDPRNRCSEGKLAVISIGNKDGTWTYKCRDFTCGCK